MNFPFGATDKQIMKVNMNTRIAEHLKGAETKHERKKSSAYILFLVSSQHLLSLRSWLGHNIFSDGRFWTSLDTLSKL